MTTPSSDAKMADLRQQITDLRAMNATKDEFIALASHQLRTPATGVKQYLGMLLEGYMGPLSATQRDFVQKAYDNNERQLGTINDLLQVAQIDANKIVLHQELTDLSQLIKTVANEFRRIVKSRQQNLIVRGATKPVMVQVDVMRLRMALDNIIDNASKYAEPDTTVTLKLSTDDTTAYLSVTDHGVGIAAEDMPKLFQKFSRIDNPRSILVGGNGLGLYLVKRIIDAHGGGVTVESELGKGTTFTLHFPLITTKV